MSVSRRQFLAAGAAGAAGLVGATLLPGRADAADAAGARPMAAAAGHTPAQLSDIEHVVILMQENRSFDHYYGTMHGVRGFADPTMTIQATGQSILYQPDPFSARSGSVVPWVLPWRFNTTKVDAQGWGGLSHAWEAEHPSWNNGKMDGFVLAHRVVDDAADSGGTSNYAPGTMGYFTRADIPWQYALADAYTICDGYHASVLGPTNPNRIMSMSATVDPDGTMGGPCIDNSQTNGQLRWTTYPERLQAAGIDWYLYQETDNFTDNMLPFFKAFTDTKTDLYRRGNSFIPTAKGAPAGPALIAKLRHDVVTGNLPQVSWIVGSYLNSEHPAATPAYGANFADGVIKALQADPKVWAKTVLFINFDENDGFFDHVVPPTAPPGTPGEYLSQSAADNDLGSSYGFAGPVGLSFRVPMTIVSPFTRGGYVCNDVFDHTSTLLFLERRFGVEVPNLSAWRRSTVGDLTSAFNFAAGADLSIPKLPDTTALVAAANAQAKYPEAVPPAVPTLPTVEAGGARPTPSGIVAARSTASAPGERTTVTISSSHAATTTTSATTATSAASAASTTSAPARDLAMTGGLPAAPAAAALSVAALGAAAVLARTRQADVDDLPSDVDSGQV